MNESDPLPEGAAPEPGAQGDPWVFSARFLLAWLVPALMGIYLKWYGMAAQHGFAIVARSLGRQANTQRSPSATITLTLAEKLSFFRGELLIGFLIVPLLLLMMNRYLPRRWSAAFTTALSAGMLILFTIQLRALEEVGRYISLDMAFVALSWGWHERGGNIGYLATEEILVPLIGLLFIGSAILWALKRRHQSTRPKAKYRLRIAGELYLSGILIFSIYFWEPPVPLTPYHQSSFVRAVVSLWKERAVDTGEFAAFDFRHFTGVQTQSFANLSESELIARYRELVHQPLWRADSRYFGKEKGDNILFFVLETVPAKFLPATDDLRSFPNFRRLQTRSFIGTRHYTTLPHTRHALFSLFSSWYPDDSMNCFDTFHPDSIAPDFLHRLGSLGYATAVYSPTRYAGGMDEALFRSIDFKEQIFPDPDGLLPNVSGYDGQASWKTKRIALDLATLHLMKEDLNRWLAAGRKIAVAFVPQAGHLPYPDLDPREEGENLVGRGRAMIAMQDAWLGEILDLLEKYGQLDKTVIVILGDHGTRTLREDPSLRRGTIDESSFHVPLFIYAPRTLAQEERIPWLTSHIDVAPTVLDLLGIQGGRGSEQGTPMWDPLLAERTTFLFAEPFFGADGYYSQGNFFMWHYLSDVVYVNSQARFDTSEIVPRYSSQAGDVTRSITTMVGLEKAWHARFSEPMPRRTQASALRGSR